MRWNYCDPMDASHVLFWDRPEQTSHMIHMMAVFLSEASALLCCCAALLCCCSLCCALLLCSAVLSAFVLCCALLLCSVLLCAALCCSDCVCCHNIKLQAPTQIGGRIGGIFRTIYIYYMVYDTISNYQMHKVFLLSAVSSLAVSVSVSVYLGCDADGWSSQSHSRFL